MVEVDLVGGVVRMPADDSVQAHDRIWLQNEGGIVGCTDLRWIVQALALVEGDLNFLIDVLGL